MNGPGKILGDTLRAELKEIVHEALREERAEKTGASGAEKDTPLTADQAAALMGVSRRWLLRHAAKLPFTRRISRKNLRFSEAGLRKWLVAKKPSPR
jgi:hypothetical protein